MPPQLAVPEHSTRCHKCGRLFFMPMDAKVWEMGKMKLFLDDCNIDLKERGFRSQHLSWLTFLYLLLSKCTLGICE